MYPVAGLGHSSQGPGRPAGHGDGTQMQHAWSVVWRGAVWLWAHPSTLPPTPAPSQQPALPTVLAGGGCVLPFTHAPRSGSPPPLPLPHLSVWQGPPNQCTPGLWGHRAPAPGTASHGGSIIPQDRRLLRVCSFPRAGGRGRGACPATLALASCATLGRDLRHSVPLIPH